MMNDVIDLEPALLDQLLDLLASLVVDVAQHLLHAMHLLDQGLHRANGSVLTLLSLLAQRE